MRTAVIATHYRKLPRYTVRPYRAEAKWFSWALFGMGISKFDPVTTFTRYNRTISVTFKDGAYRFDYANARKGENTPKSCTGHNEAVAIVTAFINA